MNLLPLFLVSLAAVGLETALTRYFALASWSDYGYWVISIVMVGFAFSGVTLALGRDFLVRHGGVLLGGLPAALVACAAGGYVCTILNPFNPLQLQNPVTYLAQLGNIGLYYLALLPFFFLAGLFISLCFVLNAERIGRVYAADLVGAGVGSVVVLGLMFLCSPFRLVACLLPALAVAGWFAPRYRARAGVAATVALVVAELVLAFGPCPVVSQYKPIYAPSHTPNARVLAENFSPHGDYVLLDDFTERVNTDISNDSGMMGYDNPPRSFGLYRDGVRIASLPMPGRVDNGYAAGALDALPFLLRPHARVLLAGASGGFRISEIFALGAARVVALEPEPVLYGALVRGMGPSPAYPADGRLRILALGPVAAMAGGQKFDVIDLSADFLDAAPANVNAFTAEAFAAYLRHLTPDGLVSVAVSIQDLPVYALRMLATARAALVMDGVSDFSPHVIVYRSAWNARILISAAPFTASDIKAVSQWCDDRSFDVSLYDGIDVVGLRANLYNDLPAVSFDDGTVTSFGADDSIADEAVQVLAGQSTVSTRAFNLGPVTDDRPYFYSILKLSNLGVLLARLQILPQAEIGALVNLAVLAQAVVFAALVLLVPLVAPRIARDQPARTGFLRPVLYFPALALGFLFIEIFGIEKASAFLNDRATGFSVVISFMLIFSGLGSLFSARFARAPGVGVGVACVVIAVWSLLAILVLPGAMFLGDGLPYLARCGLVVVALAPVSVALGMPFPLGLGQVAGGRFLPWAWGLNGAFSVVATPLANLLARNYGLHVVWARRFCCMSWPRRVFPPTGGKKIG